MGYIRQIERKEMLRCALCGDAPCTKACGKIDCAASGLTMRMERRKNCRRFCPAKIAARPVNRPAFVMGRSPFGR